MVHGFSASAKSRAIQVARASRRAIALAAIEIGKTGFAAFTVAVFDARGALGRGLDGTRKSKKRDPCKCEAHVFLHRTLAPRIGHFCFKTIHLRRFFSFISTKILCVTLTVLQSLLQTAHIIPM